MALVDESVVKEIQEGLQKTLANLLRPDPFAFTRTFGISKVDEARREVTGVPTSEALDSHGEVLEYEASKEAFGGWQGNVREMHQPLACGRAVDTVRPSGV